MYSLAQDYYEKSLDLFKGVGSPGFTSINGLFHLAVDKEDIEGARKYLELLNQLRNEYDYKTIDVNYQINKAILLKNLYSGDVDLQFLL